MKSLLSLVLVLALPVGAQEAIPNGFEKLVASGKLILPGENGTPSALEKNLPPAENLRRQRAAVARNAPALKLLREALKEPISFPKPQMPGDFSALLEPSAKFREFGRLLRQESAVRVADGDFVGAMDSRLVALDLGVTITKDAPLIGGLIGAAIETIGRQDIESVAAHLDAPSCREALTRLKAIDARRPPFADILKVEKDTALQSANAMLKPEPLSEEYKKALATPEGRQKMGLTDEEARQALNFNPQTCYELLEKALDLVIERDSLPYIRAQKVVIPPSKSPEVEVVAGIWRDNSAHFSYERNVASQRLLEGTLELRAIKLETGAYPETFEAPLDPFGDGTRLVYKRDGDKYQLYSLGPDGKDDGGAEIQTLENNPDTGVKGVSDRLKSNSVGDILGPVL